MSAPRSGLREPPRAAVPSAHQPWREATPKKVAQLCRHLETVGGAALRSLPDDELAGSWRRAWAHLSNADSPSRRALDRRLLESSGLSRAGLTAGLDTMLRGASPEVFSELLARAGALVGRREGDRPVLVSLAAAPVGLALQSVLPALAARRPLLVRSSGREPWFAPSLVAALARQSAVLGDALAAVSWAAADLDIEMAAASSCERVVAYGGAEATAALRQRHGSRVWCFGPRLSIAVIFGDAVRDHEVLRGLAHDVVLFEQRGCLSLQLVLTDQPGALAKGLAGALGETAQRLPPGPLTLEDAARMRAALLEAGLDGSTVHRVPGGRVGSGAVIEERAAATLQPSPGARVVRVVPARDPEGALERLDVWRGWLQGAVLEGVEEPVHTRLVSSLMELGVTRAARAGSLHAVDVAWANGGVDPLRLYAGPGPPGLV